MKKIILIVILVLLGIVSLNIHVVQFDESFRFFAKTEMTLTDTYVDARGTKKLEILTKPALIEAGIKDAMD